MKTKTYLGTLAVLGLLTLRASAQFTVDNVLTNGLFEPYAASADADGIIYLADSSNHRIVRYDPDTGVAENFAGNPGTPGANNGPAYLASFNSPQGIVCAEIITTALNGTNVTLVREPGVVVADTGNHLIRFINAATREVRTLAGHAQIPGGATNSSGTGAYFRFPIGLCIDANNVVYIADSKNNVIRQLGLTDNPSYTIVNLVVTNTTFREPNAVSAMNGNNLWVADTRNHTVKLVTRTSPGTATLTTLMGSDSQLVSGTTDHAFGGLARFNNPRGILWLNNRLYVADTGNHTIRRATNNPIYGATNYAVGTVAGIPLQAGFANGDALAAKFSGPHGLCSEEGQNVLVADTANNSFRRLRFGPSPPPVATPEVGWIDFVFDLNLGWISVLRTSPGTTTLFNEKKFAILSEEEQLATAQMYYNFGPIPLGEDSAPSPLSDPNAKLNQPKGGPYRNGMTPAQVEGLDSLIDNDTELLPNLLIQAAGKSQFRRSSSIAFAKFKFQTATPQVDGDNASSFAVSSATTNAVLCYTTNGVDPANYFDFTITNRMLPSLKAEYRTGLGGAMWQTNPLAWTTNLTLPGTPVRLKIKLTDINPSVLFSARAAHVNFAVSELHTNLFTITNYHVNRLTFGFPLGEASSEFKASVGQTFFAPVTLALNPDQDDKMYSFQFNATVASLAGSPPVPGDGVTFVSMLQEAVAPRTLGSKLPPRESKWYRRIDTASFVGFTTNYNIFQVTNLDNSITVVTQVVSITENFANLQIINTNANPNTVLLGVGWMERWGYDSLYDTLSQDLITYSMAHDTLLHKAGKKVVLGAYGFKIPPNATVGSSYVIDLDRPSATSDGVGAAGSDVLIETPKAGFLTDGGDYLARRVVEVSQQRYIVGDAAPFKWLNAGDFGDTNLLSDDLLQVLESTLFYRAHENDPPKESDLRDAMDSCCVTGETNNSATPVLVRKSDQSTTNSYNTTSTNTGVFLLENTIYDQSDSAINYYPFGDGQLDVTDIFVTFRRSLDCSLTWWQRFHSVNGLMAEIVPNQYRGNTNCNLTPSAPPPPPQLTTSAAPEVKFTAGDGIVAPGQTILVPINAQIRGNYPLRVLALGITIQPLDGSPAITAPVQFTPNAALGAPTISATRSPDNYAAVWLNNGISGLTGDSQLGLLSITLPTNCTANSAYAIQFDHASASPNGLGAFPRTVWTGIISCANRSSSSLSDNIPDAWRLRYFGSAYNILSQANADADGDGANNWQEYKSGTNPNDSTSLLRLKSSKGQGQSLSVHWPSVLNKKYVIERSGSIYAPTWTSVSTNNGTGWDMEFQDNSPGTGSRFYRVRLLE